METMDILKVQMQAISDFLRLRSARAGGIPEPERKKHIEFLQAQKALWGKACGEETPFPMAPDLARLMGGEKTGEPTPAVEPQEEKTQTEDPWEKPPPEPAPEKQKRGRG